MKVYVVFEGPDMTYYGDAEIHGVTAGRETAERLAKDKDPLWQDDAYSNVRVEEWEVTGE